MKIHDSPIHFFIVFEIMTYVDLEHKDTSSKQIRKSYMILSERPTTVLSIRFLDLKIFPAIVDIPEAYTTPKYRFYLSVIHCQVDNGLFMYQAKRERVNEINVLAQVHVNPEGSTLNFARECGTSSTIVKRILKDNHYHDYKFKPVQTLYPGDGDRRVAFCRWLQTKLMADINYSRKIIWSDETTFTNSGIFNRKNKHYYATENPHLKQETRPQIRFHINVWCGILDDTIIGPFIIDGNFNSQKYLQLLETQLEDALDHLSLRYVRNLEGFQQDGAGPHNAALVTQYLNNRFPNNWIGTHGPVAWPPRSPCLNPLDYFFWGYLKNKVYYTPCQNMA
ncbi:hypothetical protein NQ315_015395 [Exocentrus adspersus]|uniref:Transposase n=1 Tax=Exocentrus adspersus TaxID=1586481 RepID=A0AAV8V9I2_9CUCU|nr:hypothetical protein NQ315_015395 [Exocentrus adspersus]